jgi:hypothetical protein
MLQVIVKTPEQLKTLIGQILFRPEDETDGSLFPAELAVSEIQTFLQINDDVLVEWLREKGLATEPEFEEETGDGVIGFLEDLDLCEVEDLRRYVMDEGQTPLLTHFQPGLLTWEIEDHFDRMGGTTSRTFQFTPLAELDFDQHMQWYKQLQDSYKESNELRERVDGLEIE